MVWRPSLTVDIDAQVEWQQNGSVVVRWTRPDNLNGPASLEINVGGRGWQPVSSGAHILAELDPSRAHDIELRLNSAQWQVRHPDAPHVNPPIPPSPISEPVPLVSDPLLPSLISDPLLLDLI